MKKVKILYVRFLLGLLPVVFISCEDLRLQRKYDFKEDFVVPGNFKEVNAWEFLQSQVTPTGVPQANRFDFMVQLIKHAGLEEEYLKQGKNRTFLLLTNASFTGAGRINTLLTGSRNGTGDLKLSDKTRAANLLKYHIVDAFVDQRDAVPVIGVDYSFNTLASGENSRITFRRDAQLRLRINDAADLPLTKRVTGVNLHNYEFNNGMAHHINSYIGVVPF